MQSHKKEGAAFSIRQINNTITERVGKSLSRVLHFAGAACIGNTFAGIGKLILGIISLSFFTCASAFYTLGMVTAKLCALTGIIKEEDTAQHYKYYKLSGTVLIVSSLLYIIYSIRVLFNPITSTYHMYVALAIALFTFVELAINIRGVIVYRHNHTPLLHAIKMIDLASSLICLVLTQTAILSFTEGTGHNLQINVGIFGVLMGIAATTLGIIMIARITGIQKRELRGKADD